MGWMQSQRERIRESQPVLVRTPRVRALGVFPGLGWCSSTLPRPPKGISPHPSEMPPELRKKSAQKAASTLTTHPPAFFGLDPAHPDTVWLQPTPNRPANVLALPPCNWSPLFCSGEDILVTGVCYERPFRAQLELGPLRNRVPLQNKRGRYRAGPGN